MQSFYLAVILYRTTIYTNYTMVLIDISLLFVICINQGNVICSKDLEKCLIDNRISNCQFCHNVHEQPLEGFIVMKPLEELMKLEADEVWTLLFKLLSM
jgi:hypothetical protein